MIKVRDLSTFAEGYIREANEGDFIPITLQRAVAQNHNPYADPEDIGLLVALDDDGKCMGYFGILPVMLRIREKSYKAYWFSTWNVSTKVRGMGVGTRLMESAVALRQDYLIVGSIHARRVCRRFGFWEREPLTYYRMDVSSLQRTNPLTIFMRFIRKIVRLFRVSRITIDINNRSTNLINKTLSHWLKNVFYRFLSHIWQTELADVKYKEVEQIDIEPPHTVSHSDVELHRNLDVINWMLEYPWVLGRGQSLTEGMDYYFSDVRDSFNYTALEIKSEDEENDLGYLVLSISQRGEIRLLKTLDYLLIDPENTRIVLGLVLKYAEMYDVDLIEMPTEVIDPLKNRLLGKLLLHKKERIYQCLPRSLDSPLAKAWSNIQFKLTDGDMPFT
jgi:GNAT superfamily N-acetyltransferase